MRGLEDEKVAIVQVIPRHGPRTVTGSGLLLSIVKTTVEVGRVPMREGGRENGEASRPDTNCRGLKLAILRYLLCEGDDGVRLLLGRPDASGSAECPADTS